MLSVFKKLFSKGPQQETAPQPPPQAAAKPAAPLAATPIATAAGAVPAAPKAAVGAPAAFTPPADGINVTLKGIIAGLPDNLKKRIDRQVNDKETISISRADALRQLGSGSVKIPFNHVVSQAPKTFLGLDNEMLSTMVNVPLQEILPQIKTLPRRVAQKQLEVPSDLAPVFGTGEEKSREVKAPASAQTGSRPAPETGSRPSPPEAAPVLPTPTVPAPAAAASAAEAYTPKPLEAQAPISFKLPVPDPPGVKPTTGSRPSPPLPTTGSRPSPPEPTTGSRPSPPPAFTPPPPAPLAPTPEPVMAFGDIFGQPQKLEWTPQEIVEKAASLRGVAGALITTADGLPVAHHLPSNLSGNAVAAFVPQMYTRITQYVRDLKLGDARHLTILVESTPLQIFKAGGVYFTALGKPNENLPKPQLIAIAAALGRQSP